MLNLSTCIQESARKYPTRTAYVFGETELNYAQINGAANQVANGLVAKGIKPGDKVALSCLNLPYFPIIYYGILKAGAAVVPLSVLLKKDEIAYHLADSEAKAYFCFIGTEDLPMGKMGYDGFQQANSCKDFFMVMPKPEMPSSIEGTQTLGSLMNGQSPLFDTVQTGAEDTAVVIYTSGTTGKPKGAELTHNSLLQNAILSADLVTMNTDDTVLIVLPLFHIFAMTVLMNSAAYRGAKSVLLPKFDAESVFFLLQEHKVTVFAGVPSMYWGLLHYTDDKFDYAQIAANLKICASGGAALPVNVLEEFEARFKVNILEGYGMSEGSPVVTFNQLDLGRKPGSVGKPVWGVDVKIVDAEDNEVPVGEKGELIYRGHNVMKGYLNRPEANAETLKNGWLHSGDVAVKDSDGFFFIVDRTKEMIIRGGLNVYPREVEEVIMQHDAVSMVAVIGIPNERRGEEIRACVVLKPGQTISEEDLIAWTKERIAAYKYPRQIRFMDALPMSATGKILKKEISRD
ncbi:long-chain-fatty-acid--CoA ligase [Arcticibacterium luteifluviistationis]|uniref:Long-chain-fatty-acid--CoA ligase n=1 Tax=Arcticibacterium luteifluviistationis TaxID=1784714 RepID=A0A2Z4GEV1_9BACT|nr:long-chain fatty acid--CoA ligase [Arcticibacterium luteifluviistationis]AWV99383.1 long-chain-fatty-acid--CoA ligase [Arcticibacterium luteifluviistationis]